MENVVDAAEWRARPNVRAMEPSYFRRVKIAFQNLMVHGSSQPAGAKKPKPHVDPQYSSCRMPNRKRKKIKTNMADVLDRVNITNVNQIAVGAAVAPEFFKIHCVKKNVNAINALKYTHCEGVGS